MKIAISGKGGVGKTTISGTLCRLLGKKGLRVLAIDGDPNPNLSVVLGVEKPEPPPLSTALLERVEDGEGKRTVRLGVTLEEALRRYGVQAPDNVTLLTVGQPEHAGTGCMCGSHTVVREILHAALAESDGLTLLDMEASLEHMKRGTARYVDALYVVVEPYYRSLQAAQRIKTLAEELGIGRIAAVANKIRSLEDEEAVRTFCTRAGLPLAAVLPFDEHVTRADRTGRPLVDLDGPSAALDRLAELADRMHPG